MAEESKESLTSEINLNETSEAGQGKDTNLGSGEWENLFPEEKVTEEQLRGGDSVEVTELKSEEAKPEAAEVKPEAAEVKQETKEAGLDDKKEEPGIKPEKPPSGYVPHQALHEERIKRQVLSEEVRTLQDELFNLKQLVSPVSASADDFKILSEQEFSTLTEDDPIEANKYLFRLDKFKDTQKAKQEETAYKTRLEFENKTIVEGAVNKINQKYPNIFDSGNEIGSKLTAFAEKNGFNPNYLWALTNPATLIVPPGSKTPVMLGDGAVNVIDIINSAYEASVKNDPERIRSEAIAQLETSLRKTITEELVKKFQDNSGDFKHIGEIAGTSELPEKLYKNFNEHTYARLSPEQRRRALGG